MKELDFDELDRAVNSLMTDVSKTDAPGVEQKEKTLDLTSVSPVDAPGSVPAEPQTPVVSPPPSTPTPTPKATTPMAPLATRRGGRFMDVVHPSSNMKKSDQPRATSRQGITVAPRGTFEASPAAPADSAAPETPSESSLQEPVSSQPSSAYEHPDSASEWPDPLEMADFKQQKPAPEVPVEPVSSPLPSPMQPKSAQSQPTPVDKPPLESPFLPDTKVEKRPLGSDNSAPVEEPDRTPLPSSEVEKTASDPDDQLPALPKDVEPILPEEFHSELVAIEADTHILDDETPKPVDAPLSEREKEEIEAKKAAAAAEAEKSSPVEVDTPAPSGPTSIPQQYREEPNTGDKESGAIYDTDTYHQPLAHPAKKKSGWLWVVWIVLILLVGAGAGAALFFLGII
jgi:hypothetical protein